MYFNEQVDAPDWKQGTLIAELYYTDPDGDINKTKHLRYEVSAECHYSTSYFHGMTAVSLKNKLIINTISDKVHYWIENDKSDENNGLIMYMRKDMNNSETSMNAPKKNKKRTGGLAGKIAILCTVVLIAGGGVYTYRQATSNVPELTTFVDHEETIIIDSNGQEVPLTPGEPKVTTKTRTSRKTVMLKKPARKTRTKKKTRTKESTDTQRNGSNDIVTKTTVVTVKRQKFKKNSRKKIVITKVTTTTEVSVQAAGSVQAQAANNTESAKTVDIKTLAPKLNSAVMNAYTTLGFTVTIDPSVSYSGYFNARNQAIILQKAGDTVYHEMGHFLAFVAGNVDKKADFTAIYNEEKGKYTGTNKNYVTQNASEYFAESFKDYTLNPSALQKSRPKTYQAVVNALGNVTAQQINKLKLAYGPIWK